MTGSPLADRRARLLGHDNALRRMRRARDGITATLRRSICCKTSNLGDWDHEAIGPLFILCFVVRLTLQMIFNGFH